MSEDEKEIILGHLQDALSEMRDPLFAKGELARVEDLESSLWFGEVHSLLMHLTTLLFESGLPLPENVYGNIAEAGRLLNAAGFEHRAWGWERLKPQCQSDTA